MKSGLEATSISGHHVHGIFRLHSFIYEDGVFFDR